MTWSLHADTSNFYMKTNRLKRNTTGKNLSPHNRKHEPCKKPIDEPGNPLQDSRRSQGLESLEQHFMLGLAERLALAPILPVSVGLHREEDTNKAFKQLRRAFFCPCEPDTLVGTYSRPTHLTGVSGTDYREVKHRALTSSGLQFRAPVLLFDRFLHCLRNEPRNPFIYLGGFGGISSIVSLVFPFTLS